MNITLEKVLQADAEMSKIMGVQLDFLPIPILVTTVIIMMIVVIYADLRKNKSQIKSHIAVSIGLITGFIGFSTAFFFIPVMDANNNMEWEKNYAFPYIEQLETQTKEITHLTLGFSREEEDEVLTSTYTKGNTLSKDLVPVEVFYEEDGEAKSMKIKTKVSYKLEDNEKPYMEFIYLEEDLPNYNEKGYYNMVIYTNK